MKKILFILAAILMLSSCGVTYYTYYEVNSLEMANIVSKQDAEWSYDNITPSRMVAAYPDSTGTMVYLMETKMKDKK